MMMCGVLTGTLERTFYLVHTRTVRGGETAYKQFFYAENL